MIFRHRWQNSSTMLVCSRWTTRLGQQSIRLPRRNHTRCKCFHPTPQDSSRSKTILASFVIANTTGFLCRLHKAKTPHRRFSGTWVHHVPLLNNDQCITMTGAQTTHHMSRRILLNGSKTKDALLSSILLPTLRKCRSTSSGTPNTALSSKSD